MSIENEIAKAEGKATDARSVRDSVRDSLDREAKRFTECDNAVLAAEKAVTELRAKKAAEPKTVGQRIANHMVRVGNDTKIFEMHYYPGEIGVVSLSSPRLTAEFTAARLRDYIAAVVDKVSTDATLAERDTCAKVADEFGYHDLAAALRRRN